MTSPLPQDNKNLTGTPSSSPNDRSMGQAGGIPIDTALNLLAVSSFLEASSRSCSQHDSSPPQSILPGYANQLDPAPWEKDLPSLITEASSEKSSSSSCAEEVLAIIDSVLDILEEPIGDI